MSPTRLPYQFLVIPVLLAIVFAPGCAPATMAVDPQLAEDDAMRVQGRQFVFFKQRVRFGPYDTHDLKRSWTHGSSWQFLWYQREKRRQTYSYTFREEGVPRWHIDCDARYRRGTFDLGVVEVNEEDTSGLECRLASVEDPSAVWWLRLSETNGRPLEGRLVRGDALFQVIGSNRIAGGLPQWEATGYHVLDGDLPVGAVDVLNAGSVRLSRLLSAEGRDVISGAASALLLYNNLRD